ncbi:hypothetical protein GR160_08010 [Flavobacterium sp. Sd200]|uniref:hypothetical protein n=1 Tax=Flavobacterium sp. Sd200 TaxID=2692211 RepID=UPI001369337E|nr:hypothetical protein [Flavobacterium sp. Sd200]MXN91173.1 hypothetical protein [Flavobacterium sp. Sd200]
MNMQEPLNRVAIALQDWRTREQRLEQLFSVDPAQSRALLFEKLRNYERIAARFRNTDKTEERMALQVLQQEKRQVEQKLYPNFFLRLLRRLFINPKYLYRLKSCSWLTLTRRQLNKTMPRCNYSCSVSD